MEPRLPALTVEERIIEQLTTAENDARAARSKAFEQAAELRPSWGHMKLKYPGPYLRGWGDAVTAYSAALRALAKEQTDG